MLTQATMKQISAACGCSTNKVAQYLRKNKISPVGTIAGRYNASIGLYDLSDEDEAYLRHRHHNHEVIDRQTEDERVASGWLTVSEIAKKWGCGYSKAIDLILEAKVPYRWEGGWAYSGRKLYKLPAEPPRDPQTHKKNQREGNDGDWLESVRNDEVKRMVLDERKWRGMVGRRVVVELKKHDQRVECVLLRYSMCWFDVKRDNGCVETYKHSEAKIVKEAE